MACCLSGKVRETKDGILFAHNYENTLPGILSSIRKSSNQDSEGVLVRFILF